MQKKRSEIEIDFDITVFRPDIHITVFRLKLDIQSSFSNAGFRELERSTDLHDNEYQES